MILNKEQAETVYSAMCAMREIGGIACELAVPADDKGYRLTRVCTLGRGDVSIEGGAQFDREEYVSLSAFAEAYGLN